MANGSLTVSVSSDVLETMGRSVTVTLDTTCKNNIVMGDAGPCTFATSSNVASGQGQFSWDCPQGTDAGSYTADYTYDEDTSSSGCAPTPTVTPEPETPAPGGGAGDPHITKFDGGQYIL